jgi:hypothetical protein
VHTLPLFALHRSQAPRPGRAQLRKGFGGLPRLRQPNSRARRRLPSRAQRPGRAQRRSGGRGPPPTTTPTSPDYDTTQHAYAQMNAKRSGQAERSGEGGFGVSPDYGNPTRTHAEEGQAAGTSQAQRPGRAQRRRGRGLLRLRQSNSHARRRRPSLAQRPGRAQRRRGVRGSCLRLYNSPTRPFTRRRRNAARSQECVRTEHGSVGSAGKCLDWRLIVWQPLILPTLLCFAWAGDFLQRGLLLQGYFSLFVLRAASVPPRRRVAPFTASWLADLRCSG